MLVLLFGAGAALRGLFFFFPALDSDQAIIGLMGIHILEGEFPIFFWGERHSGTLESFLAALLFFVFGVSRQTLTLAPALVSLGFLWAGWRLARESFGEQAGLIALALLAIPPVFLSWNSVLPRGNYIENLLLGTLCLLLALRLGAADLASARGRRLTLLLGGLAGLAWYMSFQSIPYLIAAVVYLAWRQRLTLARALPLALLAFLVGSLPFWIDNFTTGFGSLEEIRRHSGRLGLAQGLQRLTAQIPILLGAQGFPYTYDRVAVATLPIVAPLSAGLFGAGVAAALVTGVVRRRHPGTILLALFLASVLVVILFGGFSAAFWDARYLLPLYSALPVLLAGGVALVSRWRLVAVGALALLLAPNLFSHWSLAQGELERFPREQAEVRRLLEFFRARGLTRVYAPEYWLSYWLTFDAGERLFVATPFWRDHPRASSKFPLYTYRVRAEGRPAYLLRGGVKEFGEALRAAGVAYEKTRIGRFTVLHDFRPPALGRSLSSARWRAQDASVGWAFDRDPWTVWQGTELRLDLGAVHRINQVVLLLGQSGPRRAALVVEGSGDGQHWERLAALQDALPGLAWTGDKLLLEEPPRLAVVFPPTPIRHIRVLPRPADRPWAVAEFFAFEAADGGSAPRFHEGVALEEARRWGDALNRYAARLLDEPDDEPALRRTMIAAKELGLEGWTAIYDFLSARALDGDPELGRRFARRFLEVAAYRETAWRRLARALQRGGDSAGADAVKAAMARHFTPAVARDVRFGRFDARVRFLGYALEPPVPLPGDTMEIRYYWQFLRPLPRGFSVFVRFHDGKKVRLAHDHRVLQNVPEADWRPGEMLREAYSLRIPGNLAPGSYSIQLETWLPASGQRLLVWREWWPTARHVAEVGVLEVAQRAVVEAP